MMIEVLGKADPSMAIHMCKYMERMYFTLKGVYF